jgi:hypothetical protein
MLGLSFELEASDHEWLHRAAEAKGQTAGHYLRRLIHLKRRQCERHESTAARLKKGKP